MPLNYEQTVLKMRSRLEGLVSAYVHRITEDVSPRQLKRILDAYCDGYEAGFSDMATRASETLSKEKE